MSYKPKISIVVPVYNKDRILDKSISSIIAQTYKNFEIIIINDGSSDNSLELCKIWSEKDNRIKVFTQKNKGVSEARNSGVKKCTGEWIGFVDPDDWVEPYWLERIVDNLNSDLVIWSYYRDVSRNTEEIVKEEIIDFKDTERISMQNNSNRIIGLDSKLLYPLWNKLFKRSIIEQYDLKFEPISCWEDACFVCDYLTKVESVFIMKDLYYHYCVVECQESLSTQKYTSNKFEQYLTLHRHFEELCGYYPNNETALSNNDVKLIYNIAGDFLYNINAAGNGLCKSDKLIYIKNVLNNDAVKNLLNNVELKKIRLIDIRMCFLAMQKNYLITYYVCLFLNKIRKKKNSFLGR